MPRRSSPSSIDKIVRLISEIVLCVCCLCCIPSTRPRKEIYRIISHQTVKATLVATIFILDFFATFSSTDCSVFTHSVASSDQFACECATCITIVVKELMSLCKCLFSVFKVDSNQWLFVPNQRPWFVVLDSINRPNSRLTIFPSSKEYRRIT